MKYGNRVSIAGYENFLARLGLVMKMRSETHLLDFEYRLKSSSNKDSIFLMYFFDVDLRNLSYYIRCRRWNLIN